MTLPDPLDPVADTAAPTASDVASNETSVDAALPKAAPVPDLSAVLPPHPGLPPAATADVSVAADETTKHDDDLPPAKRQRLSPPQNGENEVGADSSAPAAGTVRTDVANEMMTGDVSEQVAAREPAAGEQEETPAALASADEGLATVDEPVAVPAALAQPAQAEGPTDVAESAASQTEPVSQPAESKPSEPSTEPTSAALAAPAEPAAPVSDSTSKPVAEATELAVQVETAAGLATPASTLDEVKAEDNGGGSIHLNGESTTEAVGTEMDDTSQAGVQPTATSADATAVPPVTPAKDTVTAPVGAPNEKHKISREQTKYASAILRTLKRSRDAFPFLHPVDPVKLNCLDYPSVITSPMDLSTVESKLSSGQYPEVEAFVADVRLIFSNCYRYNGDETKAPISKMAKNLEETFDRQLKQMPKAVMETPKAAPVDRVVSGPVVTNGGRKSGTPSVTARRDSLVDSAGRPKREIHPPASRDYPYNDQKQPRRKYVNQLKYCHTVLRELLKKNHEAYAFPFYQPVDPVALNIPDYFKVIKKPMDLSTIQAKLNANEYTKPSEFEEDVRLMFKNCYRFNPAGTPVNGMGKRLENVFNQKWAEMPEEQSPPARAPTRESIGGTVGGGHNRRQSQNHALMRESLGGQSDDEDQLAALTEKMNSLQEHFQRLKNGKKPTGKSSRRKGDGTRRSSNKRASAGGGATVGGGGGKKRSNEPPVVTKEMQDRFVQKMQTDVTGEQIEVIINVLKEYMPIPESGELEIEPNDMPPDCFHRLYRYLFKGEDPLRRQSAHSKPAKKSRVMSEKQQQDEIARLQAQLEKFGQGGARASGASLDLDEDEDDDDDDDEDDDEDDDDSDVESSDED